MISLCVIFMTLSVRHSLSLPFPAFIFVTHGVVAFVVACYKHFCAMSVASVSV